MSPACAVVELGAFTDRLVSDLLVFGGESEYGRLIAHRGVVALTAERRRIMSLEEEIEGASIGCTSGTKATPTLHMTEMAGWVIRTFSLDVSRYPALPADGEPDCPETLSCRSNHLDTGSQERPLMHQIR